MKKKEIIAELREQDKKLNEIFDRRAELAKIAREQNIFNEVWEKLMADGESHWTI